MFYFFTKKKEAQKTSGQFFIKGLPFFILPVVGDVLKVFFSKKGLAFFLKAYALRREGKSLVYRILLLG